MFIKYCVGIVVLIILGFALWNLGSMTVEDWREKHEEKLKKKNRPQEEIDCMNKAYQALIDRVLLLQEYLKIEYVEEKGFKKKKIRR